QAFAARGAGATVSAPDCCLRTERQPAAEAMQRPPALHLDAVSPLPQVATVEPPRVDAGRQLAHESRAPSAVPLYTLHSLLLL
ncbi:MAG TPA: hypothetical protein VN923_06935, partial [Thermoanaerobaculia bacterium]|nr:hypothetical protein [Thermoanaerobaculia bacterium]